MRLAILICLSGLLLADLVEARIVGRIERSGEGVWPLSQKRPARVKEIDILHTSDVHGYVFERDVLEPGEDEHVGGLLSLATLVERRRAELWRRHPAEAIRFARTGRDDGILLLDAGDAVSGTYDDALSRGLNTILMQNAPFLDYDVVTIGNHSPDHGVEAMLRNVAARRQPVVLANVFSDDGERRPLPGTVPWVVREVQGVRVGIFGLTHEYSTSIEGYEVEPAAEAARRVLPALRAACDVVVCLAHLGLDYDKEWRVRDALAAMDDEDPDYNVDLFVDGHSHGNVTFLLDENSLVVQAGRYGLRAGEVRLRLDAETLRPFEAVVTRHEFDVKTLAPSPRLRKAMQALVDEADRENDRVVVEGLEGMFFSKTPRDDDRLENPASDFVVRATWEELRGPKGERPDVAVAYQKGIRNHVAADDRGRVTAGIIHRMLPFGENMQLVRVKGSRIRELAETGLFKKFAWAGLRIRYSETHDDKGKLRRRLEDLKIWNRAAGAWEAVDEAKVYAVACVGFFTRVFLRPEPSQVTELPLTNKEAFEAFLHRYARKRDLIMGPSDPLHPSLIRE